MRRPPVSDKDSVTKTSREKKLNKLKTSGLFMAILPLAACGGGGGGGGEQPAPGNNTPAPPPPPPPTPDFTENPTNVFIARDNAGRTLSEGSNSANLTVTGGTGNDNITTGSGADTVNALAGNDTINSGAGSDTISGGAGNDTINASTGNDLIRAGEGVDNVNAGAGDDAIVLVGTTTAAQYNNGDITNPAGSGNDLSSLISLADLNGRTVSEVAAGEVIDGGSGTNTLFIYGTVDLTGVTLNNVTVLVVNSDVTLTPEQIAQFTTVNGDGSSVINIEIPAGSTDNYILDLSSMDTSNIASINIDGDITVEIDDASDLSGIGAITSGAGDTLTVEVTGNGGNTNVNLGDIADVVVTAGRIEIADTVTLEIDDAADITNLGINRIVGGGTVDTGGNSFIEDVLDDNVLVQDLPSISMERVVAYEADEEATFVVRLSHPTDVLVTVEIANPLGDNLLFTFHPGQMERSQTITWQDDDVVENDSFGASMQVLNIENARYDDDDIGNFYYLDDDATPTLSIEGSHLNGLNISEAIQAFEIRLSLSEVPMREASVDYTMSNGMSGTIVFERDSQVSSHFVDFDDLIDEDNEVVTITFSNPVNLTLLDHETTFTIIDDDQPPVISVANVSANEADGEATFTVNLSGASAKVITVQYDTAGGVGTLTFNPGETSKTFTASWDDDSIDEGLETLITRIYNATNATVSTPSVELNIIDDDNSPTAMADTANTTENAPVLIDVLDNDSDADNEQITLESATVGNNNGSVSIVDGQVRFDPEMDFDHLVAGETAEVEITYTISDGINSSDGTATVTITGEDDEVIFSDGTELTELSVSTNEIIRETTTPQLQFTVDGDPVTINIEVTDSRGQDHIYRYSGTSGTIELPMDGTEHLRSNSGSPSNVSGYEITAIYFEDSNGDVTYLDEGDFAQFGFDTNFTVVEPGGGNDTDPPELTTFNILTDADNLDAIGRPTVEFNFNEETSVSYITVRAVNDDTGHKADSFFYSNNDSGAGFANIPYRASGNYTITEIRVGDTEGNTFTYDTQMLADLGFDTNFTFNSTLDVSDDLNDINLTALEIVEDTVDMSEKFGFEITFATDTTETSEITVTLYDEDGNRLRASAEKASEGSLFVKLGHTSEPGTYHIDSVEIITPELHTIEYTSEDLDALGLSDSIILTGDHDETTYDDLNPILDSVVIGDNQLNIDEGEYFIPITTSFTDGGNISSMYVRYYSEDAGTLLFYLPVNGSGGTWFGPYTNEGTYTLLDVRYNIGLPPGTGGALPQIAVTGAELDALNLPETIEIINSMSDNTAPELTHFNFVDDYVDFTAGENQIIIEYALSDDVAGSEDLYISLVGPDGEQYHFWAYGKDGVYSLNLPPEAPSGSYEVYYLRTWDQDGNAKTIYNQDVHVSDSATYFLQDLGFESSVEIHNPVATPSLALTSFDLSSSLVTLADGQAGQMLTFTTSTTSVPIDGVMVKFIDDNGILHSNFIGASSGTASLFLNPETAATGTYTLYSVDVFDQFGNIQSYTGTEVEALFGAQETSFTVTNPELADITVPALTPTTYMPNDNITPTGDILIDGVLSGDRYTPNGDGSPLIITYSFSNPDGSVFRDGYSSQNWEDPDSMRALTGEQQDLARDIFDAIEDDVNVLFVEVPDDGNDSVGQIRFQWTSIANGGASAWAYLPANSTNAGDVWLHDGFFADMVGRDTTDTLLGHVILHEVGHALGLKHPFEVEGSFGLLPAEYDGNNYTALSYDDFAEASYVSGDKGVPIDLMWIDIQALQHMYGANLTRTAGDDTYTFLPEEWNYLTIWDAGGNDTIDVSHFNDPTYLDLTPDAWNFVGISLSANIEGDFSVHYTLHIAPDTIIENATGGSGNDRITGNDVDNIINGGAGADTMIGGLGNDTFLFDENSDINLDLIDGGDGDDLLLFGGNLVEVDLFDINASNIESIDYEGNFSLDLNLTLLDVQNVTDDDNQLMFLGDADDAITSLNQGWVQGDDQNIGGETYNSYAFNGTTLLVDEDINSLIS